MPCAPTRSGLRALVLLMACALVVLTGFLPTAAGAATTPSPTPSSTSGGTLGTGAAKPPTVTFGIGPSNGKQLDGRPYFSYAASPGAVINDHFALVNISNQTLNLLVYGAAALTNADGSLGYEPDGAKQTGAGAWLRTPLVNGQPLFSIPGRKTVILPFQLTIPRNATPGDHTAGIAVGLLANVVGKNTKNFKFEQRVVAKVYVRVSGTAVAKLEVTNVHASYSGTPNPFGSGDAKVTYTVRNSGNVDLSAQQRVTVSGLFGDDGTLDQPLAQLPDLVPGSSTTFTVGLHDVLPEVHLNAKVSVTPGALPGAVDPDLKTVSASAGFWAIPWAFLVLILLLIALGYGLHRYRKHTLATRPAPSHRRSRGAASTVPAGATESEI